MIGISLAKFAIHDVPYASTVVELPAGTKLRVGAASPHKEWGEGGGVQFEILDTPSKKWFSIGTLFSGEAE